MRPNGHFQLGNEGSDLSEVGLCLLQFGQDFTQGFQINREGVLEIARRKSQEGTNRPAAPVGVVVASADLDGSLACHVRIGADALGSAWDGDFGVHCSVLFSCAR